MSRYLYVAEDQDEWVQMFSRWCTHAMHRRTKRQKQLFLATCWQENRRKNLQHLAKTVYYVAPVEKVVHVRKVTNCGSK